MSEEDTTQWDTDWTKKDTTSDTIGYKTYDTPFGPVTVYTKDQPGPQGGKAGTTKTDWTDPPPRRIRLKRKYRQ
jgi:hypothetical protein